VVFIVEKEPIKAPKKPKVEKIIKEKQVNFCKPKRKRRINNSRLNIKNYFINNPDTIISSKELNKLFPEIAYRSLQNILTYLLTTELIFSRQFYLKGRRVYAIYSTNKLLLQIPSPLESTSKIKQIIQEKELMSSKELSDYVGLSCKACGDIIKRIENVKTYRIMGSNRHYYLYVDNINMLYKLSKKDNLILVDSEVSNV
jgi:hypothetical protein